MSVSIGLAFLAGLASFLSPCVLSLVPAYVGYLSGRTIQQTKNGENQNQWSTLIHGLFFILGFSVIFVMMGVAVSTLGSILFDSRVWISRIGGVLVILFGLHMTGLVHIKYLDYDLRPASKHQKDRSYLSSLLMGIFFSAGWSPCVGPVLGAILTLALQSGSVREGIILLSAYSSGLAIPFLLASAAIGWFTKIIMKYRPIVHYVEVIMGIFLIILGFMLFLGTLEQLSSLGYLVDFGI